MATGSSAAAASLTLAAGRWLLRLTPRRRPPDAPDPGDPEVLRVEVLVHAAPFHGAFVTEASGAELRALRERLAELHAATGSGGEAPVRQTFTLRAGTVRLDLALDPRGALTVTAALCADPGGPTALRTATAADPSALPHWVAALDALLAASPPASGAD
jgi:hypothetical protein